MTKAVLAACSVLIFVGCSVEPAPAPASSPSAELPSRDEPTPSDDAPTSDTKAPAAAGAKTPAVDKPVPAADVVVKPIDPAKPVAPVLPAFACKTNEDSVTASYEIALLRKPDQDGFAYWVLQVQAGQSRLDVLRNMVRSDEFTTARAVLSDEQFVNSLYTGFLARQPDDAGKAYWLGQLNSGLPRTNVALSFVDSDEFADPAKNRQASCYF